MSSIRYQQRICNDQKRIDEFLRTTRTGIVGIAGDEFPYAVPVNYIWHDRRIYFHGMGSGKKVQLLNANDKVSFTVFKEFGTTTDPMPCKADTSYFSVMIFGHAHLVTDSTEAADALQRILDKYTPSLYTHSMSAKLVENYRSAMDSLAVKVYRIDPIHLTAKENPADPSTFFAASE